MRSLLARALQEAAPPKPAKTTNPAAPVTSPAGDDPFDPPTPAPRVGSAVKPSSTVSRAAQRPKVMQTPGTGVETRVRQMNHILDNMKVSHGTGIMLAGSTGIGKTTFVKQMSVLLGLPMILVEAPHVTEEHLINIPFIIHNPATKSKQSGTQTVDMEDYHVQLGKSYLAAQLQRAKPINDAALLATINRSDSNIKKMWSSLGGDENTIPEEVAEIRSEYRVILFLDEYFRQTSANVRNILRGILNGNIGNDRLPKGTYVIYASNLTDVSGTIEEIPLNVDFKKYTYRAPTKNEFLQYLFTKFENDTKLALKPEVIDAFDEVIKDEHISFDDAETEIRTSPRRWEQIMLYVNANVPVADQQAARALLANMKAQFQHIGGTSSLWELTEKAVRKIIADTSGKNLAGAAALSAENWRESLQHQIETKMKLGDARSYVPIIAGAPGIGKTAQAIDVAQKMNMLLIDIDCSTLTADEITGIPLPQKSAKETTLEARKPKDDKTDEGGDSTVMSVKFSEPSLYKFIMQRIEEDTDAFMADPEISDDRKKAFERQPYKYLIFFDEFNRPKSANVFNSLRRLILEKEFNDEYHLPRESIVIAAMNPYDKGTVELTGHMKDATDYLETAPNWNHTFQYMQQLLATRPKMKKLSENARKIALEVIREFTNKMTVLKSTADITADTRQFYLPIGGGEMAYMSPREYTTMVQDIAAGVNRVLLRAHKETMSGEEYGDALATAIWDKMNSTIEWVLDKNKVNSPQYLSKLHSWVKQVASTFLTKARESVTIEELMDPVMQDHSRHLKDDPDFVHYFKNFSLNRFTEELSNYVDKLIKKEEHAVGVLMDTHPMKQYKDGQVMVAKDVVSKMEYMINELLIAARHYNLSSDITEAVKNLKNSAAQKIGRLLRPEDHKIAREKLANWKQTNA